MSRNKLKQEKTHKSIMAQFFILLVGLGLLLFVISKGRRFDGENTWFYFLWYGLGRTWIENVRINYSTVILGLRTNVWTAIIVFVLGCILFVVLYQYGPDPKAQARGLAAVTADELERQSIEEEQLRQKKQAKRTK